MTSELTLAYLAGILGADGHFSVVTRQARDCVNLSILGIIGLKQVTPQARDLQGAGSPTCKQGI